MKTTVIGGGSWGTAVGSLAATNGETVLWCRREDVAEDINRRHCNTRYLDDIELHSELSATTDLGFAVEGTDIIVMAVPSHGFRSILKQLSDVLGETSSGSSTNKTPIFSLTKGLEQVTNLRMTEIVAEVMPGRPTGVVTGPNLAREVLTGHATASVAVSEDPEIAALAQGALAVPTFRVYINTDVIGAELGGSLKNVIALAAGMVEGLGGGDNTRATVLTRGLAELTRLGVAMGGHPMTLAGLAGMGDLIATSSSPQSRNRFVGEELGKGKKLEDVIKEMSQVAEGVRTTEVVTELADRYDVEMPISAAVHSVISGSYTAEQAYVELLQREMRSESELDY